jgi:hypothetical protein
MDDDEKISLCATWLSNIPYDKFCEFLELLPDIINNHIDRINNIEDIDGIK